MKELTTKEHILHFMQSGFMRLSKYDLKFVHNLLGIINQNQSLTTNQTALFDRLAEKYKRQFEKHKITKDFIAALPWTTTIKQSDPYYTQAYLSIVDNTIYFRSPYSKKFVNDFRESMAKSGYAFTWDNEKKHYHATYHTAALRLIVEQASEHYQAVNYCPIVSDLLNTIREYDSVKCWTPTLAKVNGRYMIAAINEKLYESIKDIELNNDAKTLALLAEYAIKVDDSVTEEDPLLDFAGCYAPVVDYVELEKLVSWLTALECDCVILESSGIMANFRKNIIAKLTSAGITVSNYTTSMLNEMGPKGAIQTAKFPVRIEFSSYSFNKGPRVAKNIRMTNSTPIKIT